MRIRNSVAIAILALSLVGPSAHAQTVLPVQGFSGIELRGGGHVTLRHGAVQRVTILKGSADVSGFEVERGRLKIDACRRNCPRNYQFEVLIESPGIEAVAVSGGGQIVTRGNFPARQSIAAAVNGGGQVDTRAIPARVASAAVNGGGSLLVRASGEVRAAVNGGGSIRYWGNPRVSSAVRGGGSVSAGQ